MSFTNAAPVNTRTLKDAGLAANIALPNAANQVNTNALDLVQATPFPMTTKFTAQVATTLSTGANSLNINYTIADSADNSSFTNIVSLATIVVAGNAANYPASTTNFQLPPATRRYVRATAKGEANGGNAADGTITLTLLF